MSAAPKQRSRTVFDLSPQELFELRKLNVQLSATVPPKMPRYSSSGSEFSFDYGIYERYRELHARAKAGRSAWLREKRITLKVAAQAVQTGYHPYANAARIDCVAPLMPQGYAEAFAALKEQVEAARPKPQAKPVEGLPGGLRGFSF